MAEFIGTLGGLSMALLVGLFALLLLGDTGLLSLSRGRCLRLFARLCRWMGFGALLILCACLCRRLMHG